MWTLWKQNTPRCVTRLSPQHPRSEPVTPEQGAVAEPTAGISSGKSHGTTVAQQGGENTSGRSRSGFCQAGPSLPGMLARCTLPRAASPLFGTCLEGHCVVRGDTASGAGASVPLQPVHTLHTSRLGAKSGGLADPSPLPAGVCALLQRCSHQERRSGSLREIRSAVAAFKLLPRRPCPGAPAGLHSRSEGRKAAQALRRLRRRCPRDAKRSCANVHSSHPRSPAEPALPPAQHHRRACCPFPEALGNLAIVTPALRMALLPATKEIKCDLCSSCERLPSPWGQADHLSLRAACMAEPRKIGGTNLKVCPDCCRPSFLKTPTMSGGPAVFPQTPLPAGVKCQAPGWPLCPLTTNKPPGAVGPASEQDRVACRASGPQVAYGSGGLSVRTDARGASLTPTV